MSDKPVSRPDILRLPSPEYNKILSDTYDYFAGRMVKMKDGTVGMVVGVDPRPMSAPGSSTPGADGNYLVIRVTREAKPGRSPHKNAWAMPDDLEVVDTPKVDRVAPERVTSPSPKEQPTKEQPTKEQDLKT